jgi:hypothetical protein
MADPIDLWDTIIEDGVAALDFRRVTGARDVALLLTEVAASGLHPNVLTAAHAAMEIDKLIAVDLIEPEARAAVQMRRTLLEAMSAKTPSYDLKQAMAELLDRYRIELARVVRRAAGDDPGRRLAEIGSPHE